MLLSSSDTCGGATVNLVSDSTTNGTCAGTYTETRTWDATDCSGNHSETRSQTISVIDTTAPAFGAAGGYETIQCPNSPVFTPPSASDTCGGATVNLVSDSTTNGTCAGTYTETRTWDATDCSGNHSETRSQTISVIDTTAPAFGAAGGYETIQCPNSPVFTPPSASDTCGGATVNLVSDSTTNGTCAGTYTETRTWDATDCSGNHSETRSQTISVIDTTAPAFGAAGGYETIQCPNSPVFTPPSASDTCGGATVNLVSDSTTNGTCAGTYTETRTWDATDCSGNHSETRSQTISVIDTTAPTIGAAGGDETIQCPNSPVFTPPSASDTCGGATVNLVSDSTTNGTCAGTYSETRTWDATDCSGNHSATRSQTISVVDTTAPTIGDAGADNTIQCPNSPVFTPPTASDTCGGATVNLVSDSTTNGTCAGTYTETRTWDATDCSGNHSETRSQTDRKSDVKGQRIDAAGGDKTIQCP